MELVEPGASVVAAACCGTPETLLRALARRSQSAPGITLTAGLLLGSHPYVDAVTDGHLRFRTFHVTNAVRTLVADGTVAYVPARASDMPVYLKDAVDVMLIRVSPPDRSGYASLGPSGSYTRAGMAAAKVVLAEVDESLPRTWGDTAVHVSEIDGLVDADAPTCTYESAPINEVSERIAAAAVGLLPKDPTVQLGIGSIPEAVAAGLAEAGLGRLRMVGMACDRFVNLFETGALARRDVVPDPAVASVELMGTRTLFDYADDNPAITVIPSTRCHDPRWLGTLPRFVSINTAVEIDLTGQVGSEMIGGRTVAAIGGSFDFFEGAHWSAGGLRIIALQSTTPDGRISKIVPQLAAGTAVTIPRHSVDAVVTEHGVARLAGLSLAERAEALIAIAAPDHRDALSDSFRP